MREMLAGGEHGHSDGRDGRLRQAVPVKGGNSPWGRIDDCERVADGLYSVSTPSHGGYWVSRERVALMDPQYRDRKTFVGGDGIGGKWYEEDCDWAMVCICFPHLFPADALAAAEVTARHAGWED